MANPENSPRKGFGEYLRGALRRNRRPILNQQDSGASVEPAPKHPVPDAEGSWREIYGPRQSGLEYLDQEITASIMRPFGGIPIPDPEGHPAREVFKEANQSSDGKASSPLSGAMDGMANYDPGVLSAFAKKYGLRYDPK